MRLKVNLTYEYDVHPEHYPEPRTPKAMAELDIGVDPAFILDTEDWSITAEEVEDER